MDILLQLVIDDALDFACSNDEQVDPDFALSQLQRISNALKNLDSSTLEAFAAKVSEGARRQARNGNTLLAEQLTELITNLGLD